MKFLLNIGLMLLGFNTIAQTLLPIPDTLSGPNYVLNMHKDSVQFFPTGKISHTDAFNQYK